MLLTDQDHDYDVASACTCLSACDRCCAESPEWLQRRSHQHGFAPQIVLHLPIVQLLTQLAQMADCLHVHPNDRNLPKSVYKQLCHCSVQFAGVCTPHEACHFCCCCRRCCFGLHFHRVLQMTATDASSRCQVQGQSICEAAARGTSCNTDTPCCADCSGASA